MIVPYYIFFDEYGPMDESSSVFRISQKIRFHHTGIDLVALTMDGDYWAIQCKCYLEKSVIDKPAVDSFLSTSGRSFKAEEDLKTTKLAERLWISTTNPNATEAIKNQDPQVSRIHLSDLQNARVDWEKLEKGISGEKARDNKRELRNHQRDALNKAHEYFKHMTGASSSWLVVRVKLSTH